jgi:hypothetical protein
MTIRYIRAVPVRVFPLGNVRSFPAEVGTTAPLNPVRAPRHLEYPQEMSLSAPELAIPPMEPTNGSPLAVPGNSIRAYNPETTAMTHSESKMQEPARVAPLPPSLTEEIQRALEMMRRVRTAQVAQGQGDAVEPPGNRYELPEPLVYRVTFSADHD